MNTSTIFQRFLQIEQHSTQTSAVLLALRLVTGVAFIFHGFPKIQSAFNWMGPESTMPAFLQFLGALSEFGGGIALVLGLVTALASLGLIFTMATAVFFVAVILDGPFISTTGGLSYELALVYLAISLLLIVVGPGKYSLDKYIFGEKKG